MNNRGAKIRALKILLKILVIEVLIFGALIFCSNNAPHEYESNTKFDVALISDHVYVPDEYGYVAFKYDGMNYVVHETWWNYMTGVDKWKNQA